MITNNKLKTKKKKQSKTKKQFKMNKKLPKKNKKLKQKQKTLTKKKRKNPSIKIYDIINKKKKSRKDFLCYTVGIILLQGFGHESPPVVPTPVMYICI